MKMIMILKPQLSFRQNEVTSQFQMIIDTYGIPWYKEINPTVFSIVTFPFLFGVMFGDIGHGLILFILASLVWLNYQKLELLKPLYGIRYLLLLMGFFSLFWGILYNDFMSLPLELWNSCYDEKSKYVLKIQDCTYPFGIDHKWYVSQNQLIFINSLKMKLSIILGVSHMLLGIVLKSFNAIYNSEFIEYIFEFWPQFIMMNCWFGYMTILIITKWCTFYPDTSVAPSIVASMIDMFLKFGSVEKVPIIGEKSTNEKINFILLILSFLWIPIMLLARPIHELINQDKVEDVRCISKNSLKDSKEYTHNHQRYFEFHDEDEECKEKDNEFIGNGEDRHGIRKDQEGRKLINEIEENMGVNDELEDAFSSKKNLMLFGFKTVDKQTIEELKNVLKEQHKKHSIEEVFVHSLIETIEFTLGTISNTASYLRLWALSLAHSQLAAVFYEKTIHIGFNANSSLLIFFAQHAFWIATFGVLMSMDSLEWFLHTLRLHWVEFQNKL